jgi:hypothetical protein
LAKQLSLFLPSRSGSPHGTFFGKGTIPQQTSGEKQLFQAKKRRVTMEQYKSDRSDVQGNESAESSRQSSRRGDAFSKQLIGLGTDRNTSTKPTDQQFCISKKEALESDPIERFFQTHFLSRIEGQDLSQLEQAQLAKIDRKTPISEVPEKWRMAFAVAKGRAIIEKVNCLMDGDINTKKDFDDRYKNKIEEIKKGVFEVATSVKTKEFMDYLNHIDIKKGRIIAFGNFRNLDAKEGNGKPLPNSEIFYNQLLLVLRHQQIDPSTFNLTQVIRENISNEETSNTLNCSIETYSDVPSASKRIYQFGKGSDEYYAILGTPNAYGILYLLKQHPSVFGKKEITRIEVKKHRDYDRPNVILHIGERE